MSRFLFKILLHFLLPLLLLVCGYEILLRKIPNDYSYKDEMLRERSSQIETLIMGSSHSLRGVNPEWCATEAFNLAMVSQTLELDYLLFVKYRQDLPQLKKIILPISYFSLFSDMETGPEPWRMKNYAIYYQLNPLHGIDGFKNKFELLNTDYRLGLSRIVDYYVKGINGISCDENGWAGRAREIFTADYFEKRGSKAANRHTENLDAKEVAMRLEKNLEYLNALISWSQTHHITVLLFLPPAHTAYRKHLNPDQLQLTIELSEELEETYSNCRYLNLLSDSSFTDEDFFDADHLNENGAIKLTELLDGM